MTKEQKTTVAKQVGIAVLISAITGALGTIIYVGWIIYIAVTFSLPTQFKDATRVTEQYHNEFITFKGEQSEKHVELNGRLDGTTDKFAILVGYMITFDKKLNTAINFQDMLRRSAKENTQSVLDTNLNTLTVNYN